MRRIFFLLTTFFVTVLTYGQAGQFIPSESFSSGLINDICQDQYGMIWVGTENGLNKYDGYRFTSYFHQSDNPTSLNSNIVTKIYCDHNGQLWIGTRMGLLRYLYNTDDFKCYPFTTNESVRVISLLEGNKGDLLVGTSGRGLYQLVDDSLQKIPDGYTTKTGNWYFNQMLEDKQGRFWKVGYGEEVTMRDRQGIHQFFVNQGIVIKIVERNSEILIICQHGIASCQQGTLSNADIDLSALGDDDVIISSAYQDREGNLYLGTRGDGLFIIKRDSRKAEKVECTVQGIDLSSAQIGCIYEDRQGNLWLGCQHKGLVMIPKIQPQFSSWSFSAQGYRISSPITGICEGDNGMVWCTVQGHGVFGFNHQGRVVAHPVAPPSAEFIYRDNQHRYWLGTNEALYSYDPLTGRSQRQQLFMCDKLNDMTDNGTDKLYVSTYSRGFCAYNMKDNTFHNYLSTDKDPKRGWLCNNWILAMMPDHEGRIWMGTSAGLSCYDPQKDSFRPYGWDCLLNDTLCYSLCETSSGDILIGTDQGLYCYHPGDKAAKLFKNGEALRNKAICYIVQSNNGDIWCTTSMGIWQYDAKHDKFIAHISGNGLTTREYVTGVGMHTTRDMVYFANNDGLTVFCASEIAGSHENLPDVKLTGFYIGGNPVNTLTESNGQRVVEGPVIENDSYRVSYLDNAITLEFSLLDFVSPNNVIYEYRINEGKWRQNPEGSNSIHLSHLQAGSYQIEVRALSAGVYSAVKTITVKVTPPWYRSGWAYLIYIIGIIGILIMLGLVFRRRAQRRLYEEKMQFLMNATHDIRSPLTLILGPLNKLKAIVQDYEGKNYINTIDRNAQRLLQLVNQILDEQRIDKHQMQIHCRETNMVDFIGNICNLYQCHAEERSIIFSFEHAKGPIMAWIDRVNFDKVINNLLSNAFKFTPEGGMIKVILSETDEAVQIEIQDNGVGLKDVDIDKLFDRFYQGRNSSRLGLLGTGIGLNLSYSITKLHGGELKARSLEQGSSFVVTLPKGNAHLGEAVLTDTVDDDVKETTSNTNRHYRMSRILVVDDDQEIADYIMGELGDSYKFDYSPNGKDALKTLLTNKYDLVISDVKMPEMDGVTLLKRIKDNPQISQLPVILLTSKFEVEYRLEGLKSGADAYLVKPFNMEELQVQIDNLLSNIRRLRGKFSGALQQENRVENIEVKGNDDALMDRVMKSVNEHMSDVGFNVDALAEEVGISRAQLHRKMKEITGISSGKFLRNLRMEQAARLLREGRINVSQVADSVGYNDQAHFSTAFKSHFGMSPTEYAEKNKES